jgi:hypothetical protein
MNYLNDTPDEKLSYSELKDRIREECTRVLLRKERIILMAKKLEDDLTLKDTICDQICSDLGDVTSEQYIRRCLPGEYNSRRKEANNLLVICETVGSRMMLRMFQNKKQWQLMLAQAMKKLLWILIDRI